MDSLEKIIRPIVEGQIKGFLKEHPEVLERVTWYKPRQDRTQTFINSLAKRIVRDLCCPQSRERVRAALLEPSTGEPSGPGTIPGTEDRPGTLVLGRLARLG